MRQDIRDDSFEFPVSKR